MFKVCNLSQSALEGQIQAGEKKLSQPEHKDNAKLQAHVEECKSEWLARQAAGKIPAEASKFNQDSRAEEPEVPSEPEAPVSPEVPPTPEV